MSQKYEQQQKPVVSVCVVTYNQEKYISQCLQSIVDQEFDAQFEVLVSDDASKDQTPAIIEDFARRYPGLVRPIINEKNMGAVENFRHVHSLANGEYIAHMDGDDYWLPGKLQAQIDDLKRHPAAVVSFTNARVVNEQGAPLGIFSDNQQSDIDLDYLIGGRNFLQFSSMLYRSSVRSVLLSIPGNFIDFRVYVEILAHGTGRYLTEPYSAYRINSNTSTITAQPLAIRLLYIEALTAARDHTNISITYKSSLRRYLAYGIVEEIRKKRFSSFFHLLKAASKNSSTLEKFKLALSLPFYIARYAISKTINRKIKKDVFHQR